MPSSTRAIDWPATFAAVETWVMDGTGLECVQYADGARYMAADYWAEYLVSQVEETGQLRWGATHDPNLYYARGSLRVTLTLAFIALSNAPEDFAMHWASLFRVRSQMEPLRTALRAGGVVLQEIGPTVYFEEQRDDRIYSRAEQQITLDVCVDYQTDGTAEAPEPVESVEVSSDLDKADGAALSVALEIDKEQMPQ